MNKEIGIIGHLGQGKTCLTTTELQMLKHNEEKERGIEITSTTTHINFPITNTMPDEYPFVPRFTKDNFKKPKIKKPFWKNGKLRHK